MNYGLPYLGSKSKIAEKIIDLFPEADNFYDLFAGGCAITDCLLKNKNNLFRKPYKKIIINDINNTPKLYLDALNGKYRNEKRWISREDFKNNLKLDKPDPYIKTVWSFGNNGKNYLFSKDLEPIKKAFHYVVMFNDFTFFDELYKNNFFIKTLNEYGIDKPELFLTLYKEHFIKGKGRQQHLKVIKWIQKNYINIRYSFAELQRLEQLQQLQQLQQDYKTVPILPNSVIYCDIPYKIKGTIDYTKDEFNHKEFWEWAESQTNPVFVSEYNYTGEFPEKWKVVYEEEKISLRTTKNGKRLVRIEKVFWNKV